MADRRRITLILAEDEPLVRYAVEALLVDDGRFEVVSVESADQALSVLRNRTDVAVLFTDHNMPGSLSGAELAQVVHQHWPAISIVLATGQGKVDPPLPPLAVYVQKPYDPERICELIAGTIAAHQAGS